MLKRCIEVKGIKTNASKRNPSYSIVNAIEDKDLKALKRPNKGRKYNRNTPKDRNNRTKRLVILGRFLVGSPRYKYSWLKQTPKHVILLCPLYTNQEAMLLVASIENYNMLLLI